MLTSHPLINSLFCYNKIVTPKIIFTDILLGGLEAFRDLTGATFRPIIFGKVSPENTQLFKVAQLLKARLGLKFGSPKYPLIQFYFLIMKLYML